MQKIFFTYLLLFLNSLLFSQNKPEILDRIITKEYNIIECNISKVTDFAVEYSYKGEKIINSIETSKIAKIQFANGRVQEFKNIEATTAQKEQIKEEVITEKTAVKEIKKNTVAVLPIPFVNKETLASSAEMAKFAQNDMYNALLESASNIFPLQVQDLRVTNSLLKKAGIDYTNIDETPIEDLQNILGVDHVVAAKVSYIVKVNQSNVTSGNTEIKQKNDKKATVDDFSYSSTTETKTYDFMVYFDLYKENTKVYSKTREPFFDGKNSWMDSMEYLLKRSPIYTK